MHPAADSAKRRQTMIDLNRDCGTQLSIAVIFFL